MEIKRAIEALIVRSEHVTEINIDAIMAYKLAIKALEKQIPRKVEVTPCIYGDEKSGTCVGCGNGDLHTINGHECCFRCGQKLDWN